MPMTVSPTKRQCHWVHRPNSPGVQALYCGEPVMYKMVPDDDGTKRREYNAFCPMHQRQADQDGDE